MNKLTKAQLTVGLLAFFATMWSFVIQLLQTSDILMGIVRIGILLVVLIVLSVVLLGILEWVDIFDLQTNSLLTFLVLITIGITAVI